MPCSHRADGITGIDWRDSRYSETQLLPLFMTVGSLCFSFRFRPELFLCNGKRSVRAPRWCLKRRCTGYNWIKERIIG